jgi:hypothetical protein
MNGPSFLWEAECFWPEQPADLIEFADDDEELKKKSFNIHSVTDHDGVYSLLNQFSTWTKLKTSIAWFLRFNTFILAALKSSRSRNITCGPLRVYELRHRTHEIVRLVQEVAFSKELELIRTEKGDSLGKVLRCTGYLSPFRKLNLIIVDGILRVGGRLQTASIGYNASHPVILPQKHPVIQLIINHYHQMEGHVGSRKELNSVFFQIYKHLRRKY